MHSDSSPAVHFSLCRMVGGPELIPVQNGFTGAGRKRFIAALASSLKMRAKTAGRDFHKRGRDAEQALTHRSCRMCVSLCVFNRV